jgi:hypothetical protein
MPAYDLVTSVHNELGADQEMIAPYQFGLLLIDWTNPQNAPEGQVVLVQVFYLDADMYSAIDAQQITLFQDLIWILLSAYSGLYTNLNEMVRTI